MKFHETHFDEYIKKCNSLNIHEKHKCYYKKFPDKLEDLKNLIFYGPSGCGKYTQMLWSIKKYSPSNLKYEKKICISYNKSYYYFMVSDIHVEIDLSLLGCTSKLLWNEIYKSLINIFTSSMNNICIIVCKNFQDIHNELLENFYSHMQTCISQKINLKYILLTESISFIPSNIINICKVISIPRPSKSSYIKISKHFKNVNDINEITNIKHGYDDLKELHSFHKNICDSIITEIQREKIDYIKIRDKLYDIFIYQLNIYECIWYIFITLIKNKKLKEEKIPYIYIKIYNFFKYYNNNYRPIYHLESFIFTLIDNFV